MVSLKINESRILPVISVAQLVTVSKAITLL